MADLIIIGLDPSLRSTGYATPDRCSAIRTKSDPPECYRFARDRLEQIVHDTQRQIQGVPVPTVAVVEGYSYGSHQQYLREVTELRGVLRLLLYEFGAHVLEVPPATLKLYATGKGNAPKDLVVEAARRELGYQGSSDDEADALWLRQMGLDWYGPKEAVDLGLRRADVLSRVGWPEL